MFPRGHAEANHRRLVPAVFLDPCQQLGEAGIEGAEGAGHTLAGHDVDEGVGELAQDAHALVGGSRRDKGHVGKPAISKVGQLEYAISRSQYESYPPLEQSFRNDTASSGGRSTTMKPLTPATLQSRSRFS